MFFVVVCMCRSSLWLWTTIDEDFQVEDNVEQQEVNEVTNEEVVEEAGKFLHYSVVV